VSGMNETSTSARNRPSAFWPAFWLAVVLVGAKAFHWGVPEWTLSGLQVWLRDLAASAHTDVFFALVYGLAAQALLWAFRRRPAGRRRLDHALVTLGLGFAFYGVVSVKIFDFLRSPLTYPLIYLADDMGKMSSSIGTFLTPGTVASFVLVPVGYLVLVALSRRYLGAWRPRGFRILQAVGLAALVLYLVSARAVASGRWSDRADHLIVRNPHWAYVESVIDLATGGGFPKFAETYPPEYMDDFRNRPAGSTPAWTAPAARPKNVVLIVLESTAAYYTSLYGSPYKTTPHLESEASNALVFDNFHCNVGLTANALACTTLSIYPYMTWREYTVEYPTYPGTTLAQVLKPRGYPTLFIHTGYLSYTNQRAFLQNRGFDQLLDWEGFDAGPAYSSWGGEDRVLFDRLLSWIDRQNGHPFFAMAWTIQGHHPYDPSPGQEIVDFFAGRELPPDDYDLGRYLNIVHEADEQVGRFFDGLRQRGLADDTLVVVTGDHGQAFGHPHPTWGHGFFVYQENVHVPLMIWNPRLFPKGERVATVGSHIDLAPTIADIMGVPPAATWQGRSLFAPDRPPRAYFYAVNQDYLLGVREDNFKYIYNATRGREELFDLVADPEEQRNLAANDKERSARLRKRLVAWRDHAAKELEGAKPTLRAQ
jgi:lipoteichoic acid synthase